MTRITLDLPEEVVGPTPQGAEQFAREMRLAAALFW